MSPKLSSMQYGATRMPSAFDKSPLYSNSKQLSIVQTAYGDEEMSMSKFDENLACIGTSLRNTGTDPLSDKDRQSADVTKKFNHKRDQALSPLSNSKRHVQKNLTGSVRQSKFSKEARETDDKTDKKQGIYYAHNENKERDGGDTLRHRKDTSGSVAAIGVDNDKSASKISGDIAENQTTVMQPVMQEENASKVRVQK